MKVDLSIFDFLKKDRSLLRNVILTSLIVALISHGFVFFNVFSYHDNITQSGVGTTIKSGRFTLYIIEKMMRYFLGSSVYNLPVLNGVLTIVFLSLSSYMIIKILDIKNNILIIIFSCLMVTSPSITTLLAYRFTSYFYTFSLMLGYIYIISRKSNSLLFIVLLSIFQAFTIGIYQAYISSWLTIVLLYVLKESYVNKFSIKDTVRLIFRFVPFYFLSLVIYLLLNRFFLFFTNSELSSYRGISTYGLTNIYGYLHRIFDEYKTFLFFGLKEGYNIFVLRTFILYYIIIFVIIVALYKTKTKFSNGTWFSIVLLPICIHFNIFMTGINNYSAIQAQSAIYQYLLLILIIDIILEKLRWNIKYILLSLFLLVIFQYSYFANMCGLKANFLQSQAKSYFNNLAARIEQTDGYEDNLPICYIGEFEKNINNTYLNGIYKNIYIQYYRLDDIINNYSWKSFLREWIGFNKVVISEDKYINNSIVKNMPTYPKKDSIKVIDGVIIVKFAE